VTYDEKSVEVGGLTGRKDNILISHRPFDISGFFFLEFFERQNDLLCSKNIFHNNIEAEIREILRIFHELTRGWNFEKNKILSVEN